MSLYSIAEEDGRVCEHCMHWRSGHISQTFATYPGGCRQVGQCTGCDDDNSAPYVEAVRGDAFVFTAPTATCSAFCLPPDVLADYAAEAALYRSLELDRARDCEALILRLL